MHPPWDHPPRGVVCLVFLRQWFYSGSVCVYEIEGCAQKGKRKLIVIYDWGFRFKNLGPVRDAVLKLGNLTIITGRNNSGKTYLAYTLYGFLRNLPELADDVMREWSKNGQFSSEIPLPIETISKGLLSTGKFDWPFSKKDLVEDRIQLIGQMCRKYSHNEIDNVFSAETGTFAHSTFEVEVEQGGVDRDFVGVVIETQLGGELTVLHDEGKLTFLFEKDNVPEAESKGSMSVQRFLLEIHLRRVYVYFLFQYIRNFHLIPDCSTSVRQAISLFYPELETNRRLTVRRLQEARDLDDEDSQAAADILRESTSRYALPIEDEIGFVKTIPNRSSKWKNLKKGRAERDLEEIVGGSFTKSDGILYFVPSGRLSGQTEIPLHLASSSAVEISRLFFHFAVRQKEDVPLLIIDEPESHLDTMNQIKFARALVRWVNSGMRILVSTHSDFIVKEINNLIMLNGFFDKRDELMEELGYDEGDSIDPSKIKAYYAVDGGLEPCSMNAFGIEVRSFEDSIDELIRVSGVLGSRLILEEGEDE